jgi:L-seryl-tRNA(Ser) seleniumtransferase
MKPNQQATLRRLPKVDEVLAGPLGQALLREAPRWAVLGAVRGEIDLLRGRLRTGQADGQEEQADGQADGQEGQADGQAGAAPADGRLSLDEGRVRAALAALLRPALRRVVNATGVVLHTNLGRSPLPTAALRRIAEVAGGYSNLEYRLEEGERGSRHEHLGALLAPLTGAEAHLVVNNNAAAVMLVLGALCAGREVVVSRGELVEIGGSFRVPDVMRASGALLREVGTTNRTHLADYEGAIGERTAALLKVHRSNYALVGFTREVPLAGLARCARERGLLSLCDLGSGALLADLLGPAAGAEQMDPEPTARQAVASGCDVVTFSCDKLLGGPQAGVICGRRALIEQVRRHPLMRAVRPDKLTLLALCATLELYRDGEAMSAIPALRMLAQPEAALRERAEALAARCQALGLAVEVVSVRSAVGGGSLPQYEPRSWAVASRRGGAQALAAALRRGEPPVVARVSKGRLLCDVRTVLDEELEGLAGALHRAVNSIGEGADLA